MGATMAPTLTALPLALLLCGAARAAALVVQGGSYTAILMPGRRIPLLQTSGESLGGRRESYSEHVRMLGGTESPAAKPVGKEYMLAALSPPRAAFLLFQWDKTAQDSRSAGFQPESEAIGERALKLKQLSSVLPELKAQANILGLCSKGALSFDKLQEPHASIAKRLSSTKIIAAISAGQGSAIAFVSREGDVVSIDSLVVNPTYLIAGEKAERTLLQHIAAESLQEGATSVVLTPSFQVDGDAFYAAAGFVPSEDAAADADGKNRRLVYRAT